MFRPDGTIEIEKPQIIITPQFTRNDFLASSLFSVTEPWNQNDPYSRYVFNSILAQQGQPFGGSICFKSGRLYDFGVATVRPEFGDDEKAKHQYHKEILQTAFQKAPDERVCLPGSADESHVLYQFTWGKVSAGFDIKTGYADIYVLYAGSEI